MKLKKSLLLPAFLIITQFCFTSCNDDDSSNICSGKVEHQTTEYACIGFYRESGFFAVVQDMPRFGEDSTDLENYITGMLDICGMEEIKDGEILAYTVIDKEGSPCVSKIISTNVFADSHVGLSDIINNMPNWTPGKQMGVSVRVYIWIKITIANGAIKSIEYKH